MERKITITSLYPVSQVFQKLTKENTMAKALLIVDMQNDFVEEGSLAVAGGVDLAQRLADFLLQDTDDYDRILITQDWHIEPGDHFSDTPDFVDSWPVHCVADTQGAAIVDSLDKALAVRLVDGRVRKGMYEAAYSGFEGTTEDGGTLTELLRGLNVTDLDIVGIATDHCVKASAIHAVEAGFNTTVLTEFTIGITPESTKETLEVTLPNYGVTIK